MAITLKKKAKEEPKITFIQKAIRGDTYLVLSGSAYEPEDEFVNLYFSSTDSSKTFIEPPYNPKTLARLVTQNNILSQCVEAMEVNIDGTGYELEPSEPDGKIDKDEEKRIRSFLDEPYPGRSLLSMRRDLRKDTESIGYAFFEILRNMEQELVGLRYIPAYTMRFVRLDKPVRVTKTLMRDGKEVKMDLWARERRFAQKTGPGGADFVYYKEFGSTRRLHRVKGDWVEDDTVVLKPEDTATEVLLFRLATDVDTPYGLPRWVNQIPSVVGSRKAEEHNLEFFDAGGMPPAIIFVQGGTLAKDMADQLKQYLSGQHKNRHRAAVVEAQSSSGNLDSAGAVKVSVERFGAEATKDSMFSQYDKNTEEHVRVGFRLPPLFLGKAADYNYASAAVSYMIAEAQVFGPERTEFDEIFNKTVMKELGAKTCKYKSKPITLKDLTVQIEALKLAQATAESKSFMEQLNLAAGLNLEVAEPKDEIKDMEAKGKVQTKLHEERVKIDAKYAPAIAPKMGNQKLLKMAQEFCFAEGLVPTDVEYSDVKRDKIRKSIDALEPSERERFDALVGVHLAKEIA